MNPLYDFAITAYSGALSLASHKNVKAAKMISGRRQTSAILRQKIRPSDRPLWFHASSLGEFEQARPLIERIRVAMPEKKIVVSFYSPSGYEVRKNYPLADAVVYLPEDKESKVREFLDLLNPSMAIFVKYDFWRNLLETLYRRKVPVYLISGIFRGDQLFFKPWGGFYRRWLRWFDRFYLQDEGSRKLLEGIGLSNCVVAGDTRFDRVSNIRDTRKEIPEAARFCGPREGMENGMIMVAGSSWGADEALYGEWVRSHPEVRLILAPHEFDSARVGALLRMFGEGNAVTLSEGREHPEKLDKARVLIIDCFGLLSSLYAYADIAYVGGGFGAGLHNINEAAVYGIPVLYGPNNHKFIEAREMRECGGGIEVKNRQEMENALENLLKDVPGRKERGQRASEYISRKTGATDIILKDLFGI